MRVATRHVGAATPSKEPHAESSSWCFPLSLVRAPRAALRDRRRNGIVCAGKRRDLPWLAHPRDAGRCLKRTGDAVAMADRASRSQRRFPTSDRTSSVALPKPRSPLSSKAQCSRSTQRTKQIDDCPESAARNFASTHCHTHCHTYCHTYWRECGGGGADVVSARCMITVFTQIHGSCELSERPTPQATPCANAPRRSVRRGRGTGKGLEDGGVGIQIAASRRCSRSGGAGTPPLR